MSRLKFAGLGLMLLAAVGYGLYALSNARSFQLFGDITARVETSEPVVALTLDDGPSSGFTDELLQILRDKDVKATFFLTGREASENPDKAKAIAQAGHEIGNHSWSHRRMVLIAPATVADEIERTDAAIRAAGYVGPLHFRPPYGKKLVALPWYLSQHARRTIMWDVEPESFPEIAGDAKAIANHVVERAGPGSIIILHGMYRSGEATRQAMPEIIDRLRLKGLHFATVSELLAAGATAGSRP